MIRSGSLNDPSRSVISLALMARSAAQIILAYEKMYRTGKQNLPWPQVRRTCTAAEIILLSYSRYELDRREAGNLMTIALGLMKTQGVRWKSAAEVRRNLIRLSEALCEFLCMMIVIVRADSSHQLSALPIKVDLDEREYPSSTPIIQQEILTGSSSYGAGQSVPSSSNLGAFPGGTSLYSNASLPQDTILYGGAVEEGYWDPFANMNQDIGLVEWGNFFV